MSKTYDQLHKEYTKTVKTLAVVDERHRELQKAIAEAKEESTRLRSTANRLKQEVRDKLDEDLTETEARNYMQY